MIYKISYKVNGNILSRVGEKIGKMLQEYLIYNQFDVHVSTYYFYEIGEIEVKYRTNDYTDREKIIFLSNKFLEFIKLEYDILK